MSLIDHHAKHAGKPTRKTAINAKCCECMGWAPGEPYPPALSTLIRDCSAKTCPLFAYRPYKPVEKRD